ncbi:MAG: hypothetical protein ACKV2T_10920 [Kofleriaceae bacterium]
MAKKPAKAKAKAAKKAAKPTKKAAKPASKKSTPAKKAPAKKRVTAKSKGPPSAVVHASKASKPAKASATSAPKAATQASTTPVPKAASTTPARQAKPAPKAATPRTSNATGNVGAPPNWSAGWKPVLRDELAKLPDDFATYCAESGASVEDAWEVADTDELRGIEAWGKELAERDRRLGVAALVAAAQSGFARAMKNAGTKADNMGFHASEGSMDGQPVETQIERGAAWLSDPSEAKLEAVVASLDPSRQLNVWDEDLLPQSDDDNWYWYSEVGQCIAHAISGEGGEAAGTTYYEWTPALSVGRGLVMAVRGLRTGNNDANLISSLRTAMIG